MAGSGTRSGRRLFRASYRYGDFYSAKFFRAWTLGGARRLARAHPPTDTINGEVPAWKFVSVEARHGL